MLRGDLWCPHASIPDEAWRTWAGEAPPTRHRIRAALVAAAAAAVALLVLVVRRVARRPIAGLRLCPADPVVVVLVAPGLPVGRMIPVRISPAVVARDIPGPAADRRVEGCAAGLVLAG